jgi:hypothetical protein
MRPFRTRPNSCGLIRAPPRSRKLHSLGKHVVCCVDVGTWENHRPDKGEFPKSLLGKPNGWLGERWLDIRRLWVLRSAPDSWGRSTTSRSAPSRCPIGLELRTPRLSLGTETVRRWRRASCPDAPECPLVDPHRTQP